MNLSTKLIYSRIFLKVLSISKIIATIFIRFSRPLQSDPQFAKKEAPRQTARKLPKIGTSETMLSLALFSYCPAAFFQGISLRSTHSKNRLKTNPNSDNTNTPTMSFVVSIKSP